VAARFSAHVQTGHEANPAHCTIGTESFPGVKYGQDVLLTTYPLLVPRFWKSRALYLYPPSGPHRGCNGVTLRFYYYSFLKEDEEDNSLILKVTSQRSMSPYCHLLFLYNFECLILRRPKIHRTNMYHDSFLFFPSFSLSKFNVHNKINRIYIV
jgi:hypothetical protein